MLPIHSCALSRSVNYVAIDSQVCFHRWLFADPAKLYWCITGPVLLGSNNQNWWDTKLLPMAVSIYPVVCIYPCCLLRAQHRCLWPNGRENTPLTCLPTPTTPTPSHLPLTYNTHDIKGVPEKLSQ